MTDLPTQVDVLIIGAGLSGIGAAHELRRRHPRLSLAVLEARERIGGTWDLFRYPGVRSDSDMATLGYGFRPWDGERTLAGGEQIRDYIQQTANALDNAASIHLGHRVVAADFDTAAARWSVTVDDGSGAPRMVTCRFLYSCTGYYNYDSPYQPHFEGEETFAGRIIHPQFWPPDLSHAGRRVVVIGSGATAVTLVPALAAQPGAAAEVTMIQRSPTWIGSVPGSDPVATRIRRALPRGAARRVIRARSIVSSAAFYQLCRRVPDVASGLLTRSARRFLTPEQVAEHFTPSYRPWDQRLCAAPDADIFRAIGSGRAQVRTASIRRLVVEGVELATGEVVPADIIVTATGLQLQPFGGLSPTVDGHIVDLSQQYVWKGTMVTGLPNFGLCIGYVNSSWTLRAQLCHRVMADVVGRLRRTGHRMAVPQAPPGMPRRPLLELSAGYIRRSIEEFPHLGDRHPWLIPQNYPVDRLMTLYTHRTDGLEFIA